MKRNFAIIFGVLFPFFIISCEVPNVYDDSNAIINNKDMSLFLNSVLTNVSDTYNQKVNKFNGMETIRTINKSGELTFEISLIISSGRFKMVLVKDNDIILVTDENTDRIISFNNLENGTYKLKIIGDEAKFDLKFKNIK